MWYAEKSALPAFDLVIGWNRTHHISYTTGVLTCSTGLMPCKECGCTLSHFSLSCMRSKSQSAGAGLAVSYFLIRLMHKEEQPSPGTYHVSYNIRMAASMTYHQLETTI